MILANETDRSIHRLVGDTILGTLAERLSNDPRRKLNSEDWTRAVTTCLEQVVANPLGVVSQDEEETPSFSWPNDWHSSANIRKWYESACHAAGVLVKVMHSGNRLWTYPQFSDELARRYPNYNETVKRLAWKLLPDTFKNGPGRPSRR